MNDIAVFSSCHLDGGYFSNKKRMEPNLKVYAVKEFMHHVQSALSESHPRKKNVHMIDKSALYTMDIDSWSNFMEIALPRDEYFYIFIDDNPSSEDCAALPKKCMDTPTSVFMPSFEKAMEFCEENENLIHRVCVQLGGDEAFNEEVLDYPGCTTIHLARFLFVDPDADLKLSIPLSRFCKNRTLNNHAIYQTTTTRGEGNLSYTLECYHKIPHEEYQYLELIRDVMSHGSMKGDRTGTGVASLFGRQMRFSLRNGTIPVLTTKRVYWRGVVEELLWFVRGDTNSKHLAEKKVHIWDDNGSKEFLEKRGLGHREEGDLGPVYGFQWRHWGAKYKDVNTDYTGAGIDQLQRCIDTIKNNPEDRRIIMTAWNPSDLNDMALPPCHMMCQFYVSAEGELSCQMYQRSCDIGLGVPFNIASYALLTHMVAHVCGLKAGDFVHVLGDAHIYNTHREALVEQLVRVPREFPTLEILRTPASIDEFQFEDFKLNDYKPHKGIKMEMAV